MWPDKKPLPSSRTRSSPPACQLPIIPPAGLGCVVVRRAQSWASPKAARAPPSTLHSETPRSTAAAPWTIQDSGSDARGDKSRGAGLDVTGGGDRSARSRLEREAATLVRANKKKREIQRKYGKLKSSLLDSEHCPCVPSSSPLSFLFWPAGQFWQVPPLYLNAAFTCVCGFDRLRARCGLPTYHQNPSGAECARRRSQRNAGAWYIRGTKLGPACHACSSGNSARCIPTRKTSPSSALLAFAMPNVASRPQHQANTFLAEQQPRDLLHLALDRITSSTVVVSTCYRRHHRTTILQNP